MPTMVSGIVANGFEIAALAAGQASVQETGLAAKYSNDRGLIATRQYGFTTMGGGNICAKWGETSGRRRRQITDAVGPVAQQRDSAIARGKGSSKVQLRKHGLEATIFVK